MPNKELNQNQTTRRKFFLWGAGILASVGLVSRFLPKQKEESPVKMLGEDGKLVEVNINLVKKTGLKASDKEVQNWIKNKPTNQ